MEDRKEVDGTEATIPVTEVATTQVTIIEVPDEATMIDKSEESVPEKEENELSEVEPPKSESDDLTMEEIFDVNKLVALKYTEIEMLKALQVLIDKNPTLVKKSVRIIGTLSESLDRSTEMFTEQYYHEKDRYLKSIKDKGEIKHEHIDSTGEKKVNIKDNYLNFNPSKTGIQDISGSNAIDIFLSSDKNLKRVRLINSGFFIDVQCPLLSQLNSLYTGISDSMDEYGYMFGTFFYLFADLEIKRIISDLIFNLIVNSNLKGWSKKSTLFNAISINDYPAIIMTLGAMMYRNGYDIKSVCPKCGYVEEEKIDPALLKYHNFEPITNSTNDYCLNMISSTTEVSLDDVNKYQKELQKNIFTDGQDEIDIDGFVVKLKVASIDSFLSYGDEFNKKLLSTITSKDKETIVTYMKFSFFRMLSPWISSITKYSSDDKTKGVRVKDIATISKVLDHLQKEKERAIKFREFVDNFIKRSALTHTCYPVNPCPKCKKDLTESADGFVFFDPQKTFFMMSAMKLTEAL